MKNVIKQAGKKVTEKTVTFYKGLKVKEKAVAFYNDLKFAVQFVLVAFVIILGVEYYLDNNVEKEFNAVGVSYQGWDELTVKTENGEEMNVTLRNIDIVDTPQAWEVFNKLLVGKNLHVSVYGLDEKGNYLVEVKTDGYDFDAYALKHHHAVSNPKY